MPTGFKFFDFTATDLYTGQSARSRFSAGQDFVFEPARFLNESVAVDSGKDIPEIKITNAVFSNTGSQIMFAVKRIFPGEEVVLAKPGEGTGIRMIENGRAVVRDTHTFEPQTFDRHGVTLGRVDFVPIQNLDNTVRVEFDDMYRKIAVNREISLERRIPYAA
jgi:hypothetical protein